MIKNLSVGYWIHSSVRTDGEDGGPDIVEVRDWEPLEISAVPIPADPGAQIRSANRNRPRDRQSPAQRAAAYARGLLTQSTQSAAQARGAAEARRALGNVGKISNVPGVDKVGHRATAEFHRLDMEAGAREARRLLRLENERLPKGTDRHCNADRSGWLFRSACSEAHHAASA